MATPLVALTIAASDPLGGAGIQADLSTFAALGVHGTSAITGVTAQSLTALTAVVAIPLEVVAAQIDGVAATFTLAAAKTGMLRRPEVIELVASRVRAGSVPAPVVDPVMVDGKGVPFVGEDVEAAYREHLFPIARLITPNRAEAELLAGVELPSAAAVLDHSKTFRALGTNVIVTGGGFAGPPDDVVITADEAWAAPGHRVDTPNVRGSGCTFAAAIASLLARGADLAPAVTAAREFVQRAIEVSASWPVDGPGPVAHVRSDDQSTSAQSSP